MGPKGSGVREKKMEFLLGHILRHLTRAENQFRCQTDVGNPFIEARKGCDSPNWRVAAGLEAIGGGVTRASETVFYCMIVQGVLFLIVGFLSMFLYCLTAGFFVNVLVILSFVSC